MLKSNFSENIALILFQVLLKPPCLPSMQWVNIAACSALQIMEIHREFAFKRKQLEGGTRWRQCEHDFTLKTCHWQQLSNCDTDFNLRLLRTKENLHARLDSVDQRTGGTTKAQKTHADCDGKRQYVVHMSEHNKLMKRWYVQLTTEQFGN